MSEVHLLDCCGSGSVKLERVRYFQRQLLTADDMVADQDYFRQKQRRHNRFLHGWGVVCGLEVFADPTPEMPWRARVDEGYGLGPFGDEIFVCQSVYIDLAHCGPGALTDPCEPNLLQSRGIGTAGELFLAIKYAECKGRPVRSMALGCGCDDQSCEYSRICDSFQIECLSELPPSHLEEPSSLTLCDYIHSRGLPPCPPCPTDPWIVLAKVTLPTIPSTNLKENNIDNFVRRQIFSTAVLQQQLIDCCCEEGEPPAGTPARITRISPLHNAVIENQTSDSYLNLNVSVAFDKDIDPNSVNENSILVEPVAQGSVTGKSVTYVSGQRMARLKGTFEAGHRYRITVTGDIPIQGQIPEPILDTNEFRLDGNKNGQEGGTTISEFTITQPLPA